ncbi:glycosyltransferase family 4 protein [Frateuria aurantia]
MVTGRIEGELMPGVLLHTAHSGIEFPRYYVGLAAKGIGVVAMIHDLIPLTHPEYCRPGVLKLQARRMQVALANVRGVIANSDATARSIAALTPLLGVKLPPMATALLAPGTAVCYPGEAPLKEPYFVILSTIEPRKNHWLLLHVWRELVDRLGDAAPTLVVIGRRGWECENVVDMLERCEALQGKVIEESECSDERLHLYLQHARALLFPSFVEGYGMPLVEALQLGVPVIASDLAVFHEIAAAIPDYLDPLDGPGWMHRVLDYAKTDSSFREQQLQRLQGYQAPTWEQHFEVVDEFIARLSRD